MSTTLSLVWLCSDQTRDPSVYLFVHFFSSVTVLVNMNELILMQIGANDPRGKGMKWSTLGVSRSKVKVTGGRG